MPDSSLHWLITGAGGMLAADLAGELSALGEPVVSLGQADLDITDSGAVNARLRAEAPQVIVNCAAYTQVDRAEEEEDLATAVNGSAVEHLAAAANATGALLVQISTDFVFDGSKREPWEVNDTPRPLSAYGRSKLVGEAAARQAGKHLVLRTSWLFGTRGNNFVEAIRGQIARGTNPLRVVHDQRGRPTYTPSLARAIIRLARLAWDSADARGVVHYADAGDCSWFEFAQAIVEESGASASVIPVSTEQFPRPARRPAYSVLSTERYERLTGAQPESWREGLREYLDSVDRARSEGAPDR